MKPEFHDFPGNSKTIAFIIMLLLIYIYPPCLAAGTDTQNRIFLTMKTETARAYQDERILLTIALYNDGLTIRDVRYPGFFQEGFSSGGFGNPVESYETIDGVTYNIMEFRTYVIPEKTGDLKLGPAVLQCNVLLPSSDNPVDSFFGGHKIQTLNLKSEEIPVRILPFPQKGRPDDFKGAVGDFNLAIEVQPKEVKVGDPISIKMIIKGKGNFDTVSCPELKTKDGFIINKPRIIQKGDTKICEQAILPTMDTITQIPAINFSFFDPDREIYLTLKRGPTPLKVSRPIQTVPPVKFTQDEQAVKKLQKKDYPFYKRLILSVFCIGFFIVIALLVFKKNKERLSLHIKQYAKRVKILRLIKKNLKKAQQAIKKGDSTEFYTIIFRTLQEYLGYKFHIFPGGIIVDIVYTVLRPKGISEEVLKKIIDVFEDCDMARYSSLKAGRTRMEETFNKMKEIINYLEKQKL